MLRSSAVAVLLSAAAVACGAASPTEPQTVAADAEVTLAPGGVAAVKDTDVEVGFVDVVEDSRCPSDATCIWAGEVKVRLSVRRRGDEPSRREVREGDATLFGGYRIVLVKVAPHPVSTRPTRAEDYRATVRVVKE